MSIVKAIKERDRRRIENHKPAKKGPKVESPDEIAEFAKAFDQHIIESQDKSRTVENDGFHPSSLGIKQGKCARRGVYLMRGVAKGFISDAKLLRVFANGHAVHDRLQKYLESMEGLEMQSEVRVETENPPIRGHCDGTLVWNGKRYALEIKSCSPTVFEQRVMWKKPKDEHVEQVNIYAHVLGIDEIIVCYENKGTQELLFFSVKTDHEKARKQIDKWHAQYLCYLDGELPKRPYQPNSPTCAVCDLKPHCFSDSTVGVDLKPYKDAVKKYNEDHEVHEEM